MTILNDRSIVQWIEAGGMEPGNISQVNPASVDLSWSGRARIRIPRAIQAFLTEPSEAGWSPVSELSSLLLEPGYLYLLDTRETVTLPDTLSGVVMLKSSLGRLGMEHLHAGYVDPGFSGTITLEIRNLSPDAILIHRHQRLVQMALYKLNAPVELSYRVVGRYNGQSEPTAMRRED